MALSPLDKIRVRKEAREAARAVGRPRYRQAPEGSVPVGTARRAPSSARTPGPVARLVNRWWTRLLQAVYAGSLSEQEARDMIRKMDKTRPNYYNYYSDKEWGVAASYDLCVNSGLLPLEDTVTFIQRFVEQVLERKK